MMVRRSEGLSERHRRILKFVGEYQEKNGFSPSIREIGDQIGVKSTSLVKYYLEALEKMGLIERNDRVSRGIRLVAPPARDIFSVPLWGPIVASEPIPMPPTDSTYYDPESTVEIARSMLPTREKLSELFALEVRGDSMIDAMINDGDIVIMKPATEARDGEMVAVWLDDNNETTLKYFYRENNRVRLQPANPTMKPIYIDNPKQLRIMGKVVMVIRQVPTAV